MEKVTHVLKRLDLVAPIVWDRFTKTDDGYYVVYGWIARSDHNRDFVMIGMWDSDPPEEVFYTTSSAKFSATMCQVLYGNSDDHNTCRKIDELFTNQNQSNDQGQTT